MEKPEKFYEYSKWHFQDEEDLYSYACSSWDYCKYVVVMKDGTFHKFSSICDEGGLGAVSCYVEAMTFDNELDSDFEWEYEDILMWSDVTGVVD